VKGGGGWGGLTGADARLELPAVEQLLAVVGDGGPSARGGGVLPVGHLVVPAVVCLSRAGFASVARRESRRSRKIDECAYGLSTGCIAHDAGLL
jgi:hypothetical protein